MYFNVTLRLIFQNRVTYQVVLADGQVWKRHVDQLFNDNSQRSNSDVVECDTKESIDIDFLPNEIEPQEEGDPILRHSSRIRCPTRQT